jgi:asparagine synthase (glutamine-hydrolysing)
MLGLARQRPKLAGLLEYGGDYAGAYLLRRGLYLPFELETVLDRELVRAGLERLDLLPCLRTLALDPDPGSPTARVASLEASCYMRNQLLRDADWAGMAHSLEVRTPLVDFALLKALAPAIPGLTASAGKAALAAAPMVPLPATLVTRRKTGFGVPMGDWLGTARASKGAASRAWGQEVLAHVTAEGP